MMDYHTHSKYSFDGCEEIETMCRMALDRGLTEIAITDHMDIFTGLPYGQMIDFDVPGGKLFEMNVKGLYEELVQIRDQYAGRLTVRIGSELGQPQVNLEEAKAFLRDYDHVLDFVIGSVHNMENDLDVYYYDFDRIDLAQMYDHYVDWLIELAKTGDFDVMGHLTYPLRYAFERKGLRMDVAPYEEKFRCLFKLLIQAGRGIEVNVSGLYRPMQETMPPMSLLKLYRECGGEIITIGSDAHKVEFIGLGQKEARDMLVEAGFSYVTSFAKRQPRMIHL